MVNTAGTTCSSGARRARAWADSPSSVWINVVSPQTTAGWYATSGAISPAGTGIAEGVGSRAFADLCRTRLREDSRSTLDRESN